jgi:enterochelin esterase-like enzyme
MRKLAIQLVAIWVGLGVLAPLAAAEKGHYERVTAPGPSLAGNLAGDPADRQVSVYLPPGYGKERTRRYPVLYLLHGFTDNDAQWFGRAGKHFVHVPEAVDAAFEAGVPHMIVVMPNGFTKFQGSMYSSSAVNGDWDTFIARDLVKFIDGRYRTLARPESRGLAGHSMGGYGTLRAGMKTPGGFSALYAMSPCCLAPNLQPDARMLEAAARITSLEEIGGADFFTKAMLASAAAWSPNPKNPPLYIDLPWREGKMVPEVVAEWAANAPLAAFHANVPALRSFRAIAIDAGDRDQPIASTVTRMHELLGEYGMEHEFEIYAGDHLNRIHERLVSKVLPFFGRALKPGK